MTVTQLRSLWPGDALRENKQKGRRGVVLESSLTTATIQWGEETPDRYEFRWCLDAEFWASQWEIEERVARPSETAPSPEPTPRRAKKPKTK